MRVYGRVLGGSKWLLIAGAAACIFSNAGAAASSKGTTVSISPAALTFSGQNIGATSAAQTITISNSGSGFVSIGSIAASGDFTQSNTCGSSLAMAASCTISVSFQPGAIGTRTGALTITDNAPASAQTVTLSGTGVGVPQALLAPANLSFSNQSVNTV